MANYINNATLLSALTAYRDELTMSEILTESVFSARTAMLIKKATGINGTQTINLMTSQPVWAVASCGLQAGTGSVTLAQQDITVSDISLTEDICLVGDNTLSKYYTGQLMTTGINQEELTPSVFAKAYIADKILKTTDTIEKLLWIGNKNVTPGATGSFSSSQYANLADGFLYQLQFGSGTSSVVSGNGTYSGAITEANAINVINGMVDLIPEAIADKELKLFVSLTAFRKIVRALINSNNYHYTALDATAPKWEISWPFDSNITIVATSGLNGRNDMVLTYGENLYEGTDGEHDFEQFKIWFSDDLNAVRFRQQFRLGTAIAFPQYVVYYKG